MKKLLVALIMTGLLASFAMAQLLIAPEGTIAPNGALHYVVPTGPHMGAPGYHGVPYPFPGVGYPPPGPFLYPMPLYPVSYPMVPVPAIWGEAGGPSPSSSPMQ